MVHCQPVPIIPPVTMDSPPAEMAGLPSRFPPIVSRFCVAPHYLTPAVRRYEPLGRASPVTLECSTWPDQSDWQNLWIFFLLFLIWRRDQVLIRAAREEPQPCISNCCPASRAPIRDGKVKYNLSVTIPQRQYSYAHRSIVRPGFSPLGFLAWAGSPADKQPHSDSRIPDCIRALLSTQN